MPTPAANSARDAIFISYRRNDARGASGRLYDWLRIAFGREKVFRDVASIGVGRWRDKIDGALAQSAVCVAVVGQRWANAENLLRLHDAEDPVRLELLTALGDATITIVPTLVEGAAVPPAEQLPAELRPLFGMWNARSITENGWEDDTRRLIGEIADATKLPVVAVLDELMSVQRRFAALARESGQQAEQIERLNRTINDLRDMLADAPASQRSWLEAAFAALARGDSLLAEDAFEREYEAQTLAEAQARQKRATAARNVANLALLRDARKAADFYRKVLTTDPDDADAMRLLGTVLITLGDLNAAKAAMSRSLRLARSQQSVWAEMTAKCGLGDIAQATGDLPAAIAEYESARQLANQGISLDEAKGHWHRDLAIVNNRLGDLHSAQGSHTAGLEAYRRSLVVANSFAGRPDADSEWRRDQCVSHHKIGHALVDLGDARAGLAAFEVALGITRTLVNVDPSNTQLRRDLHMCHDAIGDVWAMTDNAAAHEAYREGLAFAMELSALDHANARWQRELSLSHSKIGNVLLKDRRWTPASTAYRESLSIAAKLAARDPSNTQWQRDLSLCQNKIGNVFAQQGNERAALDGYLGGHAIAQALAQQDKTNAQWIVDLAVCCAKLGSLSKVVSRAERGAYLERGANLLASLKAKGRLSPSKDSSGWFSQKLAELQRGV